LVAVHSLQAPASRPVVKQNGRSGFGQLGAPSAWQATQVRLDGEQSGVTPPQSAPVRQPTHAPIPEEVSQRGIVAGQWEVSLVVQAAQAPLGRQIGVAAPQSALLPQARQVCVPRSQTGEAPLHWAFDRQPTQTPPVVSQTGVAPPQRVALPAEQTPQPPEGWQAGVMPPHSLSPAQPRQVCADESQTGALGLPQSASAMQATHVPPGTLQRGVVPEQAEVLVAEHCPQAPDASQAGVAPLQSASPAQARQRCVPVLQTGVVPLHWLSARQATQCPDGTSHAGVAPAQAPLLLLEHWPQTPDGWQAGVAPPQSPSPAQARQLCVPVSQIGVPPLHWPLLTHETQVPLPVLQ
jgi:hypothetical protein